MPTVRVSEDFDVRIPRQVRDRIELVPGQELKVHLHGDHILLVPVRETGIVRKPEIRKRTSIAGAV